MSLYPLSRRDGAGRARRAGGPALRFGHAHLVLLRHGQSTWNAENLFTGWVDVDLTATGEAEAANAGRLLAAEPGLDLATVHTSVLTRAVRTAEIALHAGRAELAPGAPALAAERAPLRGPPGPEQESRAGRAR